MSDEARINGLQISWASLRLKIRGELYSGITSIDYADSRERAYTYGMGRHHAPRGRTAGKYTVEPMVMTVYPSTAKAIIEDLAGQAEAGRGYGSVSVPIVLQYIEQDDAVITVEFEDCALTKVENSHEEGPEGLNGKLTWMPMRILRDGLALFDSEAG